MVPDQFIQIHCFSAFIEGSQALSSITQGASALSALFIFVAMNYTLRPALMPGLKPYECIVPILLFTDRSDISLNLIWDRWVAFLVSRAGAATAFQFACFISVCRYLPLSDFFYSSFFPVRYSSIAHILDIFPPHLYKAFRSQCIDGVRKSVLWTYVFYR
jgi:hypothetical protein